MENPNIKIDKLKKKKREKKQDKKQEFQRTERRACAACGVLRPTTAPSLVLRRCAFVAFDALVRRFSVAARAYPVGPGRA
jgi:hypothetical protein